MCNVANLAGLGLCYEYLHCSFTLCTDEAKDEMCDQDKMGILNMYLKTRTRVAETWLGIIHAFNEQVQNFRAYHLCPSLLYPATWFSEGSAPSPSHPAIHLRNRP